MNLKKIIFILLFIVALVVLSCFICTNLQNWWLTFFSVLGTFASIGGLLFVIIQIASLKNMANITRETSDKTKKELLFFMCSSDLSKNIKLIHEIENFNRAKKHELSIMRLQDLTYALSQVKNNPSFNSLIPINRFKLHLRNISISIDKIEKEIKDQKGILDVVVLNNNLEVISRDLIELDTRLKQSGGCCD